MGGQLQKLTTIEYTVNERNNQILSILAEELIKKGNLSGLKKLLRKSTEITFRQGTTLLHIASLHQQIACLKYLLDKRVVCVNAEDNSCETALSSSLVNPVSYECSDLLISAGVNINLKNKWLRTPLLKCIIDQNELNVLYLLDKGANPNTEDCMGCTPLNQSVYYHLYRTFNRLLDTGVDINYVNRNGLSALYFGCKSLNKTCVRKLIDLGSEVNMALIEKLVQMSVEPEKCDKFEVIFHLIISALGQPLTIRTWVQCLPSSIKNDSMCRLCLAATNFTTGFCQFFETTDFWKNHVQDNYHSLKFYSMVPSLKHLCRLSVRSLLTQSGGNVIYKIRYLDVPPGLKSMILLQDVI
ncbi:hypothetical protein LOTGIDRAFT_237358 [Lottia gigantea]|uniref:SOCS box domain-containing protein n=1 Tax=Lottia gigantea TaxID=225164 RepID=V4B2Y8_LOTGI|nr:hypothetical protein LOTGIDRAFT_237358 [Lottia gigantea]ESP04528.1 hypothetical protein LOTGIDRAFT_237358 [Lottia gigantea]